MLGEGIKNKSVSSILESLIRREIGSMGRGSISNRVVREDLSEKRFEPKLEGGQE